MTGIQPHDNMVCQPLQPDDSVSSDILEYPCGGVGRERTHCLLNEFPALVWRAGTDGKCCFFNRYWLEFTGRSLEQELGDGWAEGVHPDDLESCVSSWRGAFNARLPFDIEYRLRRFDGEYRWIYDSGRMLTSIDGEFSGYIGSCFDVTNRKKSEEVLTLHQEQLKLLADKLFLAEERERRKISADLHDRIGQPLALSKIRLKRLSAELTSDSAVELLDDVIALIDQSIQEVRSLTVQLSPPLLYEIGFEAAVDALCEKLSGEHGIRISVSSVGDRQFLGEDLRVLLYHAVRELLVNVVKHSSAQEAVVTLNASSISYWISIEDDGVGFDPLTFGESPGDGGVGLFNLKQKIKRAGGVFSIDSEPGNGCRISMVVPLVLQGEI